MIFSPFSFLPMRHAAARLLVLGLMCSAASAQSLDFIIDKDDGAVYIKNSTDSPVTFDGYQLTPFSFDLVVDNWTPIAGNYDTAGDLSVDSTAAWVIGAVSPTGVAEFSSTSNSALLTPGQIVDLGLIALGNPFENNLAVQLSSGSEVEAFLAETRDLTADYDGDLDVDGIDYLVFASTFGSEIDLRADGNGDGVVDAADYTVWRDSPELDLTPAVLATAAFVVPEPASLATLSMAVALLSSAPRRRRG